MKLRLGLGFPSPATPGRRQEFTIGLGEYCSTVTLFKSGVLQPYAKQRMWSAYVAESRAESELGHRSGCFRPECVSLRAPLARTTTMPQPVKCASIRPPFTCPRPFLNPPRSSTELPRPPTKLSVCSENIRCRLPVTPPSVRLVESDPAV